MDQLQKYIFINILAHIYQKTFHSTLSTIYQDVKRANQRIDTKYIFICIYIYVIYIYVYISVYICMLGIRVCRYVYTGVS